MTLQELSVQLATTESKTGKTFITEYFEDAGTLTVKCSDNPDFVIVMAQTPEQIMAITPLFDLSEVDTEQLPEFYETLLRYSPVLPLASLALRDNTVVLFGSMSVNTLFDNIVHELECQFDQVDDVLIALESFLVATEEVAEVQ